VLPLLFGDMVMPTIRRWVVQRTRETAIMKPFSEACEENKHPILQVLQRELTGIETLLEIGSGTGQHAVFFGEHLPHILWQTSDVPANHPGILAWLEDANLTNVLQPLELDVAHNKWPQQTFDAVFSANTAHIMSKALVRSMFEGVGTVLESGGKFCLYGPINYHGEYTSESNARFDQWLKQRDPESGIKDIDWLTALAGEQNMLLIKDYEMPVNNRTLVWQKSESETLY
jgi:hypothetical protein